MSAQNSASGPQPAAAPPPALVLPIRGHLVIFGLLVVAPPVFVAGYLAGDPVPFGAHDAGAIAVAVCIVIKAAYFYGRNLGAAHKAIQSQVRQLPNGPMLAPLMTPVREANETMAALVQAGRHLSERTASLRFSEERFRGLVEDAPVGIFRTGGDGRYSYVNARWTAIVGSTPDQLLGDAWLDLVHPDDRGQVLNGWRDALAAQAPFMQEYRCVAPDGRTIWVQCHAVPETDVPAGLPAPASPGEGGSGYIGTLTNITERRLAEISRDEVEEQLRHAIAAGRMGIWEIDLLGGTGRWDPYLYRMFGLEPDQLPVTPDLLRRHVVAEDLSGLLETIKRVMKTRTPALHEFRIVRPDGELRWLVCRGNVVATRGGLAWRMAGVTFDITEAKRQEEKQSLLIGELSHRVKNTLAVLQAIAYRSLRATDTPEAFVDRFTGRLHALANAHSLLTATDWDGTTLRELITQETSAAEWQDQRVSLTGPEVMLKPELALALALVLHELTTNAIKHGALSTTSGRLNIVWVVTAQMPRQLDLRWIETGGPPIQADRPRGFGSDLIERSLGHGHGGTVTREFAPTGVTVQITVPLA
jgi:PAS domain S-box-containing protein